MCEKRHFDISILRDHRDFHKGGDQSSTVNHRPVSLVNYLSKIFEMIPKKKDDYI